MQSDRSSAYESDAGEHNPSAIYPTSPDNGVGQLGFQNEQLGYERVYPQETYENVKIEEAEHKISYSNHQNGYGAYEMQNLRDGTSGEFLSMCLYKNIYIYLLQSRCDKQNVYSKFTRSTSLIAD